MNIGHEIAVDALCRRDLPNSAVAERIGISRSGFSYNIRGVRGWTFNTWLKTMVACGCVRIEDNEMRIRLGRKVARDTKKHLKDME